MDRTGYGGNVWSHYDLLIYDIIIRMQWYKIWKKISLAEYV
jgi:hypothetical protein